MHHIAWATHARQTTTSRCAWRCGPNQRWYGVGKAHTLTRSRLAETAQARPKAARARPGCLFLRRSFTPKEQGAKGVALPGPLEDTHAHTLTSTGTETHQVAMYERKATRPAAVIDNLPGRAAVARAQRRGARRNAPRTMSPGGTWPAPNTRHGSKLQALRYAHWVLIAAIRAAVSLDNPSNKFTAPAIS